MDLNKWVSEHTYHHSQFSDLPALIEKKKAQGLKVSVCIPTLNEEQTIGKVIVVLRGELMERYPLIDELAVIDSGSSDRTLAFAKKYGADTYLASEILPHLHDKKGKGENLWKAIYQLNGDVIVYIDADINNIHPRFVYGLLGPLIERPEIQYVKAFYDRPFSASPGVVRNSGGGRVTEILIRPLFSLFFPELTGIIQPLSGEYAVRREVLQRLYFPIGYGVETSHLIDVYSKWGMEGFAQTDLDRRVHRNQDTTSLGKMAFGILQTFMNRQNRLEGQPSTQKLTDVLKQFEFLDDEHRIKDVVLKEEERQPMESVAEYRAKFE